MNKVKSLDIASDMNIDEYKEKFSQKIADAGTKLKELMNKPEVRKNIDELKQEGMLKSEKLTELIKDSRFTKILDQVFTK